MTLLLGYLCFREGVQFDPVSPPFSLRRYVDFQWLHNCFTISHPSLSPPPLPPKDEEKAKNYVEMVQRLQSFLDNFLTFAFEAGANEVFQGERGKWVGGVGLIITFLSTNRGKMRKRKKKRGRTLNLFCNLSFALFCWMIELVFFFFN